MKEMGLLTYNCSPHQTKNLILKQSVLLFYYRKTYALVSNQVCKPGFCIRRRSGTHVIPTLARGD